MNVFDAYKTYREGKLIRIDTQPYATFAFCTVLEFVNETIHWRIDADQSTDELPILKTLQHYQSCSVSIDMMEIEFSIVTAEDMLKEIQKVWKKRQKEKEKR